LIFVYFRFQGDFKEGNFSRAMATMKSASDDAPWSDKKSVKKPKDKECLRLVRMVMECDLAPVIVFSFAKRECETYAKTCGALDFNTSTFSGMIILAHKLLFETLINTPFNSNDGLILGSGHLLDIPFVLKLSISHYFASDACYIAFCRSGETLDCRSVQQRDGSSQTRRQKFAASQRHLAFTREGDRYPSRR
jgi:hypothetical protein